MGITAKELARKLNLSAAAVSMALNHKPGVRQHGSSSWMPQKNMDMIFPGSRKNIPLPGRFILLSIKNMEQLLQIPRFSLRFPREFHRDAKRMTIV